MTLPASLLTAVERHPCFSGHYRSDSEIQACIDPGQPTARLYTVSCGDCLVFRPGVLTSHLPPGMSTYALADTLSAHVRSMRGYRWSVAGYFTAGGGFWLSAAYYGNGLFLVDASRNRNGRAEVDMLVEAFRHGVLQPEDPRMLDPQLYTAEPAYLNMAGAVSPVGNKHDLVHSSQYSGGPRPGYGRASILEFQPLAHASQGPSATPPPSAPPLPPPPALVPPAIRRLVTGDLCPKCGHEVKERPLFTGTYVGCLC
jgi:hypothetical protein